MKYQIYYIERLEVCLPNEEYYSEKGWCTYDVNVLESLHSPFDSLEEAEEYLSEHAESGVEYVITKIYK